MNPYEKQLEGRDALDTLREGTPRLRAVVAALGSDGLARSLAPGKWTAAQIIAHLADCEIGFSFRIRQVAATPDVPIQPFDQDAWSWSYAEADTATAVETFAALRKWNIQLLERVSPEQWSAVAQHPERGPQSLRDIAGSLAGHDRHHLAQLETLAAR